MELGEISDNKMWAQQQLASLWKIDLAQVDQYLGESFDCGYITKLFDFERSECKEKIGESHVFDGDSIFSIWSRSSCLSFIDWALVNGLDVYPTLLKGRTFSDSEQDYIYHNIDSDHIALKVIRSFPATVKEILQWNEKDNVDALLKLKRFKLYIRNPPSIYEWDTSSENQIKNSHGERVYCGNPFRDVILNEEESYFCCSSWHAGKSLGDPRCESLKDIWNGLSAQEFRQSIIDGSYRYCRHNICHKLVNRDHELHPIQRFNQLYRHQILNLNGKMESGFAFVNCGFDNSCNLSCPSCRDTVIVAKGKKADSIKYIEQQLEESGDDIEELYISGSGDVFGSPHTRKFISRVSHENFPNLKSVYLHCNGQLINEYTWNKLPSYVRDRIWYIEISIDAACKKTYEINRRGGSYQRLLDNLAFVKSLRRTGVLSCVKFSFVVQKNNYKQMPDFVDLALRYHADIAYFCRLMNWGTFSNEEYAEKNVCDPEHPEHLELKKVLRDERLDYAIVNCTNLGVNPAVLD